MMRDGVKWVLSAIGTVLFICGAFSCVGLLWAYTLSLFGFEVSWWAASVLAFALRVGAMLLYVESRKPVSIGLVNLGGGK